MPQGVEHLWTPGSGRCTSAVPKSVMPQGVEHPSVSPRASRSSVAPKSVMPQGVEHAASPFNHWLILARDETPEAIDKALHGQGARVRDVAHVAPGEDLEAHGPILVRRVRGLIADDRPGRVVDTVRGPPLDDHGVQVE